MPSSNLTLRIWDHCSTGYYWGRFWIVMLTHRHRGVIALMLNSLSLNKILSNSLATHCWIVCRSMSWNLTNFQIKIYQDIIHQRIPHINVLVIYIYRIAVIPSYYTRIINANTNNLPPLAINIYALNGCRIWTRWRLFCKLDTMEIPGGIE